MKNSQDGRIEPRHLLAITIVLVCAALILFFSRESASESKTPPAAKRPATASRGLRPTVNISQPGGLGEELRGAARALGGR